MGGTYAAGQDIKVAGNGQLAAMVYAPVFTSLNGGGSNGAVYGAAVGYQSGDRWQLLPLR